MLARISEFDSLSCECGAGIKVFAFLTEHRVIRKILDHVRHCDHPHPRAVPVPYSRGHVGAFWRLGT